MNKKMRFYHDLAIKKRQNNLENARLAIAYANRVFAYGSSNKEEVSTGLLGNRKTKMRVWVSQRSMNRPLDRNKVTSRSKQFKKDNAVTENFFARSNFKSKLLETGNCEEMSMIAFEYLAKKNIYPLELFYMEDPGDHAFVVIGRNQNTNPYDPRSWNAEAIICDPWAGEAFPGNELSYGLFLKEPARERKHILQSKGHPIRVNRKESEKDSIQDYPSDDQINNKLFYLLNLIGILQSAYYHIFTQREFFRLEEMKSWILHHLNKGISLSIPELNKKIASFADKMNQYQQREIILYDLKEIIPVWQAHPNNQSPPSECFYLYGYASQIFKKIKIFYTEINTLKGGYIRLGNDLDFTLKIRKEFIKLGKNLEGNNIEKITEIIKETIQKCNVSENFENSIEIMLDEVQKKLSPLKSVRQSTK